MADIIGVGMYRTEKFYLTVNLVIKGILSLFLTSHLDTTKPKHHGRMSESSDHHTRVAVNHRQVGLWFVQTLAGRSSIDILIKSMQTA